MSGDMFDWEARDAATHSTVRRTDPTMKNYPTQNASGVVEIQWRKPAPDQALPGILCLILGLTLQ